MSVCKIDDIYLSKIYRINGSLNNYGYDIESKKVHPDKDPYSPGRILIFEDDFDDGELNLNNWSYVVRPGNTGQLQYYKQENVYLEKNYLVIDAKKESYSGYSWTSGRIESRNKKYWTYGRIEAKIKMPKIYGAFPAFWTMGNNNLPNPHCGEIDIVEIMPRGNNTIDKVYANLWNCDTGSSLGNESLISTDIGNWHIYSIEWTKDYISALFDNREITRWNFSDFDQDAIIRYLENHYVIFNLAIGGTGGEPSSSVDRMKMLVDWVRVYAPLYA